MDTITYFRSVRAQEELIEEEFPLVITLENYDGGREGVPLEVKRTVAARMIVDKKARLATDDEIADYRAQLIPPAAEPRSTQN